MGEIMENGGFIPWDEWKPKLLQFNCPYCMGVKVMPDGEELEQRLLENLDLLGDEYQKLTKQNKQEQNETKGGDGD